MSALAVQWCYRNCHALGGDGTALAVLQWLAWNHREGEALDASSRFIARALGMSNHKKAHRAVQKLERIGMISRAGTNGQLKSMKLNIRLDFQHDEFGQLIAATGTIEPQSVPKTGTVDAKSVPKTGTPQTDDRTQNGYKAYPKRVQTKEEEYKRKKRALFCGMWGVRRCTDEDLAEAELMGSCYWDASSEAWIRGSRPDQVSA